MMVIAGHHIGTVYHAAGHPDLRRTRPIYAFVPSEYTVSGAFDKAAYIQSRWPSINAGANPHAIGSHVMADTACPVDPKCRCPVLPVFLTQIESIARVKIQPTKP